MGGHRISLCILVKLNSSEGKWGIACLTTASNDKLSSNSIFSFPLPIQSHYISMLVVVIINTSLRQYSGLGL